MVRKRTVPTHTVTSGEATAGVARVITNLNEYDVLKRVNALNNSRGFEPIDIDIIRINAPDGTSDGIGLVHQKNQEGLRHVFWEGKMALTAEYFRIRVNFYNVVAADTLNVDIMLED